MATLDASGIVTSWDKGLFYMAIEQDIEGRNCLGTHSSIVISPCITFIYLPRWSWVKTLSYLLMAGAHVSHLSSAGSCGACGTTLTAGAATCMYGTDSCYCNTMLAWNVYIYCILFNSILFSSYLICFHRRSFITFEAWCTICFTNFKNYLILSHTHALYCTVTNPNHTSHRTSYIFERPTKNPTRSAILSTCQVTWKCKLG